MGYIICGFFTDDSTYRQHADGLKESMVALGITNFHLDKIPPISKWVNACAVKPEMIKGWLEATDQDVVYIDVDARFKQRPALFDSASWDIGICYKDGEELLSGVIYLRNSEKVRTLVDRWVALQRANPDVWDQKVLQQVLESSADLGLDVELLPDSYCRIIAPDSPLEPDVVIAQLQASRVHRDKKLAMINLSTEAALKLLAGETVTIEGIDAANVALRINDLEKVKELYKAN